MIYFIQSEHGGLVKIGHAVNVKQRLSDLQIGSPVTLVVLGQMPGDMRDESALHQKFASLHSRGEWFRPEPILIAFIAQNTNRTGHGFLPVARSWDSLSDHEREFVRNYCTDEAVRAGVRAAMPEEFVAPEEVAPIVIERISPRLNPVSRRIAIRMVELGVSQVDTAAFWGITQPAVSALMRNRRTATRHRLPIMFSV